MKEFFLKIEDINWAIKCKYNFWLHGPYGLTRIIERMPFYFLIKYMRKYGATIGTGVLIDSGIKFHRPDKKRPLKNFIIGSDTYVGHRILLDLTEKIIIGDNVAIGSDCQIWTHVGDFKNEVRNTTDYHEKIAPVILHAGALCYSHVIINPGVEIGRKVRVLAMSMISKNIPDNQVWAGVPAKFINERILLQKTILIFGAGINQFTLIDAAKKMGIKTIVIDPCENPPGKAIADVFYCVDAKDYDSTKRIASKEKVDGIVTSQMENPLRLMARLGEEMGYFFHSPEIIEQCRNKYLMKQVFEKNAIPCAKGILINPDHRITENELSINDLCFPLIVKPTDAHSSQGVVKVDNYDELINAVKKAISFSTDGAAVIEEFLDGPEYSIEAITFQGETHIIQYTEKIITPYPHTVEMGHIQPANLNDYQKENLHQLVVNAVKALQIDNSASHVEVKFCKDGFKIVEVGARLGGDFISSYLTKASTGIDMDKASIMVALGLKPNVRPTQTKFSYIKYVELPVGKKVKEVVRTYQDSIFERVVFMNIFVSPGDVISPIEHSGQRSACFIVSAESLEELKNIAEKVDTIIKEKLIKLI
jgi:biotin carboxylase/acetyltransferase-like isoleucine patch superfamily enzyme